MYSLLDGAASPKALAKRAKELGMGAIALTDHGAMYGVIDFYEACKKEGIKPIIGVEAYMAKRKYTDRDHRLDAKSYHQLLLAETYEGYQNLIKLTSIAHLDGYYYKPRIDRDLLREHSKGIIATSSCINGEIPRRLMESYESGKAALEEYLSIFGKDNFYIELQEHSKDDDDFRLTGEMLRRLAKDYSLPTIATNDCHYLKESDAEAQDVLVCVSSGKTVQDPTRLDMRGYNLSLRPAEEMQALFPNDPDAIANTLTLAERCNVEITLGENIMPVFPLPDEWVASGGTDRTYLRHLCEVGIKERYNVDYTCNSSRPDGELLPSPLNDPAIPIGERAKVRLEYELSVIEKMGFESYFLITQDFLNWGRAQGIMLGPGRGSAAGSLVGFLLHITNVDPLKHNLIFERFLNPERISMPDIDNDIEDSRRDELISYVRQRYGEDRVAQIITFGTMASRAAVRDVCRALGLSYADGDFLAKLIPGGPKGLSIRDALEQIDELKQVYTTNPDYRKALDIAAQLEGVARHTSVHAAGVVVTRDPLTTYVPIQRAAKDEHIIVTQYAMNQVEKIGLLKIDFLGLSNLSIIQQALRVIRKTRGVDIDIDNLPIDDVAAYQLLSRAETTGVFQLESAGMKRYLKDLKPTQFEDIVAMVALYRPGPMDAIPDFIEAKHGRKKVTYLHPILEPILKDSYGVIVTQDQVLEVARKFAGFTYGQADVLRKAVGKKIKALLDEQREKFISGAVTNVNIDKPTAEKVWDFVEPFARYGFNRAHAVCYAMIAYQTAYLKAHYPVEFMASLLTSDTTKLDRITIEAAECAVMGIELLPPDVNESFVEFGTVLYPEEERSKHRYERYIRFGMGAIKNIGIQAAERIVEERKQNGPFTSFTDFLDRCAANLNKKIIENLAMAGALDCLADQATTLHNLESISTYLSRVSKEQQASQVSLFGEIEGAPRYELPLVPAPETVSRQQRLTWERELLGMYLTEHPISPYLASLPFDRTPINELGECEEKASVTIAGVVMGLRSIVTKSGQPMAFVQLEDEAGGVELVVFPKTWATLKDTLTNGVAVTVRGTMSRRERRTDEEGVSEPKILVDSAEILTAKAMAGPLPVIPKDCERIVIAIPPDGDSTLLKQLKTVLERYPGTTAITLELGSDDAMQSLAISQRIAITEASLTAILSIVGTGAIRF
jgi:DNA polymerase-3 subunit alpha